MAGLAEVGPGQVAARVSVMRAMIVREGRTAGEGRRCAARTVPRCAVSLCHSVTECVCGLSLTRCPCSARRPRPVRTASALRSQRRACLLRCAEVCVLRCAGAAAAAAAGSVSVPRAGQDGAAHDAHTDTDTQQRKHATTRHGTHTQRRQTAGTHDAPLCRGGRAPQAATHHRADDASGRHAEAAQLADS